VSSDGDVAGEAFNLDDISDKVQTRKRSKPTHPAHGEYTAGASAPPVFSRGFSLSTKTSVSEEQWGDVRLLTAAAAAPCFEEAFDAFASSRDRSVVVGNIAGNQKQVDVGFAFKLLQRPLVQQGLQELSRKLQQRLRQPELDVASLITRVHGYRQQLSAHLIAVSEATLARFELGQEMLLLIGNYKSSCVPCNQPRHTDCISGGSLFNVVHFGCGLRGEEYSGAVPCVSVCDYDGVGDVSMRGAGWPTDWYDLRVSTPESVSSGTSIVAPANVIHFGVGQPNSVPDGLDLRCSVFLVARCPQTELMVDRRFHNLSTQVFEWTYLDELGETDLLCKSLKRPEHAGWARHVSAGRQLRLRTAIEMHERSARSNHPATASKKAKKQKSKKAKKQKSKKVSETQAS
jgi:hypothetical protein